MKVYEDKERVTWIGWLKWFGIEVMYERGRYVSFGFRLSADPALVDLYWGQGCITLHLDKKWFDFVLEGIEGYYMEEEPGTIDKIKKSFKRWMRPLGMLWWEVTIVYYDDPSEIVKRFREDNDLLVLARVTADWKYMQAHIQVNVPAWEELDDAQIDRAVIHELCHVLVNEMREGDIDHEERVVSSLTKAFIWVSEGINEQQS